MKTITIEIPDGKKAEWVNGVLTLVDDNKKNVDNPLLLPGMFTVNASGKKVRFSKGNLMALVNKDGSDVTKWKLAEHQYDFVGKTKAQRSVKNGWIDLFSWTPKGKYNDGVKEFGINTSTDIRDYIKDGVGDTCCDWGSRIDPSLTILSKEEWRYLFKSERCRTGVTICGIKGVILIPDNFSGMVKNSYSVEDWAEAEASGLVFLPLAGYRSGSSVDNVGYFGFCWSSTPFEGLKYNAYDACFYYDGANVYRNIRYNGISVRLVSVQ